jgi:DNA-binding transcriptional LysR family regulator
MDLKLLEVFCAVLEQKSFSKAADALNLTQPTISIHIKSLEVALGLKLLNRLGRGIEPTEEGEILYRYAREITRLRDEAGAALKEFKGTIEGELRIGASNIPGEYIMPALLGKFVQQHSGIRPILSISDTQGIYEMLLNGEINIGIVGSLMADKNIRSKEFGNDELILVAAPDFKGSVITKDKITSMPMVLREDGSGSRKTLEATLKRAGIKVSELQISSEMGSTKSLKEAVAGGLGAAFISRLAVARELKDGRLKEVKVKGFTIRRCFHIVTHRLRSGSPVIRTFLEFLSSRGA